jgi:tRNA pseudouridine38/39 synthase
MDVEKVYNFERLIYDAKLVVKDDDDDIEHNGNDDSNTAASLSQQMCYVEIHGQAFLWHQIRCIMEVLFMIGNRLEEPSIITELFNVEKYPGKPGYSLAPEKPLVLNDCGYPHLQVGYSVQNIWTVSCQLEQQWEELVLAAARIRNGIDTFQSVAVLKNDLLQFATSKITERRRKLQKSRARVAEEGKDNEDDVDLSSTLPQDAITIPWKDALHWLRQYFELVPDVNGLNTSIHIPLLQRSCGTTYEQKVQSIQNSEKRRQKYEENVIKKRKTTEEDAAFYNHMTQQGGTGL